MLDRFREWMDTPGGRWAAGLGAIAVIAATVLIWVYGPGRSEKEKGRLRGVVRSLPYYCEACGASGRTPVAIDKSNPSQLESFFPVACPECGQVKAVLGRKCSKCKRIFKKPPSSVLLYYCPYPDCGQKYDRRLGGGAAPPRPRD